MRLWDVTDPASPRPLGGPLTGPQSLVTGVAFSPKGNLLAAASQDHKLWLWRISGGRAIPDGTLTGAVNWTNAVSFSPDGKSVAAGTSEGSVLVWTLAGRSLVARIPRRSRSPRVAWDGAGGGRLRRADGTATIWTLPTPVLLTNDKRGQRRLQPERLGDRGRRHERRAVERGHARAARDPRRRRASTACRSRPTAGTWRRPCGDGTVLVLDAGRSPRSASRSRSRRRGPPSPWRSARTARSSPPRPTTGPLRLFSMADPAQPGCCHGAGYGAPVYTVAFAPDGARLAAASTDDETRLWNVADPARPRQR